MYTATYIALNIFFYQQKCNYLLILILFQTHDFINLLKCPCSSQQLLYFFKRLKGMRVSKWWQNAHVWFNYPISIQTQSSESLI